MRKKKSLTPLGELELEVLEHVWQMGSASVADVRARILENRNVAYTTIMTVMKNLADKGFLSYEKEGLSYVYSPRRTPEEVRKSIVRNLMQKVFKGSPAALVQTLVKGETLSEAERAEIRQIVKDLDEGEN